MKLSSLKSKKILLWGLGREGKASLNTLTTGSNDNIYVFDESDTENKDNSIKFLKEKPSSKELCSYDAVICSPGVSLYRAEIQEAVRNGANFISGTQLWFNEKLPGKKICITGSKGKSTTSNLIKHILESIGFSVELVGNIGRPLLETLNRKPDYWIIELSSYQCTNLKAYYDVAVILNLFEAHLDWHLNKKNYFSDKIDLLKNALNPNSTKFINKLDPNSLQNPALQMSDYLSYIDKKSFWNDDSNIYFKDQKLEIEITTSLKGKHNSSNICAALSVVNNLISEANIEELAKHITSYTGLKHRLEVVGEVSGVKYINDSISTIPESTEAALDAFSKKDITLIIGGKDVGINYDKHIQKLALSGAKIIGIPDTGHKIIDTLKNKIKESSKFLKANNLEEAVNLAHKITEPRALVIMSPGAQSYNSFKNYVERAEVFKKSIKNIIERNI